jgi:translocation and assembly module TamB
MRHKAARFLFVVVFGTLAGVLGIVTSMTLTPPGRALLARVVSDELDRVVNGTIEVGSISGSFLYGLTLQRLEVRDTQGVLLANVPRARVGYSLPRLLAGEVVLTEVHLDEPVLNIVQHRDGSFNYQDVLRLGKRAPRTGPPPLIEFHDMRVNGGQLRIALAWRTGERLGGAALDSAIAAERAKPGRILEDSPEGYRRVVLLRDLTTVISRLRISTPDRKPLTIDLDTLATRVNDPGITLTDARGRLRIAGDSAVFSLERGAMPGSEFSGGGAVTWPRDTLLYDFQIEAPRISLVDLRWVSPDFPALNGSGVLAAKSETGARAAYVLRSLDLRRGPQRITGEVVALQDKSRPPGSNLGFREMDLTLRNVDLDLVRPYLDTLPFYGTLTGTLRGEGWLDRMRIGLDWDFADARVAGNPVSAIVGSGVIGVRQPDGLYFENFRVRDSDLDLGTLQRLAPAVVVPGRLVAVGTLDGPMRNATFRGTARHRDGDRPVSALTGMVRLDSRGEELGVGMDVQLEPLSFDGIRRGFPSLTPRGGVTGTLRMDGRLSSMAVEANLTGEIGDVVARGTVTMLPPRWGADNLSVGFSRLDLNALRGKGPATSLFGELLASGSANEGAAPEGTLELSLATSRVREWTIDTMYTRAAVADSVIRVDTLYTVWKGARAGGSGTLGWARPHTGTMSFLLAADSLTAFDSLLVAVSKQARDSTTINRTLAGQATAALTLTGSLDTLGILGSFDARDLVFQGYDAPRVTGTFSSSGGAAPVLGLSVQADSLRVRTDTVGRGWQFGDIGFEGRGRADSLSWGLGTTVGGGSRFDGAGWFSRRNGTMLIGLDTLTARLSPTDWRLEAPTVLTLGDSTPTLAPTALSALDGSGGIRVEGRLPHDGPGDMHLTGYGIDLRNIYDLLSRDTTGVQGMLGFDMEVAGTAEAPTFRGMVRLADAQFGESRMPYLESVLNYADRRLDANVLLWRSGTPIFRIEAALPVDLALRGATERQLDGPISVRAVGDSVDLAILEAFVPTIDRVGGYLSADMQVQGTWRDPELAGSTSVTDGTMRLLSLGVTWDTLNVGATFAGDSAILNQLSIATGEGALTGQGSVRLVELARPELDVTLTARRFDVMRVRNLLDLTASGRFELDGPFYGATFTGTGTANQGVLYFADLLNKRVIDLDDPGNIALVDTMVLRRNRLAEGFSSRFMDELRVRDFNLNMGADFWLRSSEANIKLSGAVRANKVLKEYRFDGTLEAGPGSYTLKIGPVSRDFTVQRGTVTYFGTPDLNAELDIEAQHVVRAANGQEVPVIAEISGTLLRPRLALRSDPTIQPPLAEADLVSYLILGVPASQAQGIDQTAFSNAASILTSAVSSDVERALIADLGLPVDLLEIRPAIAGGTISGDALTQLAAGWQLGRRVFLRVNAGYCTESIGFGASVDYRFSRAWRVQTSFEPTHRSCRALNEFRPTGSYQIGFDVLFERDF